MKRTTFQITDLQRKCKLQSGIKSISYDELSISNVNKFCDENYSHPIEFIEKN